MEPPDPSFADEFNVLQKDAVLVFDVRAVSLPFQVHRLKVLVEAVSSPEYRYSLGGKNPLKKKKN